MHIGRSLMLVFILSASGATAQEHCLAHTITREWLVAHHLPSDLSALVRDHDRTTRSGGPTVIPVVVHVVWNTPAENVPSGAIQQMIATLNTDLNALNADYNAVRNAFADVRGNAAISFCLATTDPNGAPTSGITRTETTETWFDPETEIDDMKSAPKGIAAWDPTAYLNIWICDISSGLGGGAITTGYSYLPFGVAGTAVDGLVIDALYGLGPGNRTATHEVGHYLGLLHPWADGGCTSDDGMDDTPVTDSPTFTCADTTLLKCGQLTQYENFMDYSDCASMFTLDQVQLMAAVMQNERQSLLSSTACATTIATHVAARPLLFFTPDELHVDPNGTGDGTLSIIDVAGRCIQRVAVPREGTALLRSSLPKGILCMGFVTERASVGLRWIEQE